MNLQQIVAQKHQSLGGEMLLVRNTDILSTMVRIPVVVIGSSAYSIKHANPAILCVLAESSILPFIQMALHMFFMNWV